MKLAPIAKCKRKYQKRKGPPGIECVCIALYYIDRLHIVFSVDKIKNFKNRA